MQPGLGSVNFFQETPPVMTSIYGPVDTAGPAWSSGGAQMLEDITSPYTLDKVQSVSFLVTNLSYVSDEDAPLRATTLLTRFDGRSGISVFVETFTSGELQSLSGSSESPDRAYRSAS